MSIGVVNTFADNSDKLKDLVLNHLPFGWKLGETTIEDAKKKGIVCKEYECSISNIEFYFSRQTNPPRLQAVAIGTLNDINKLLSRVGLPSMLPMDFISELKSIGFYHKWNDSYLYRIVYKFEDYSIIADHLLKDEKFTFYIRKENMLEW
jgi:hypothetical protein